MSRPVQIPVCRISSLPQFARSAYTTPWRRAKRGDYGPLTHDASGRQQVEIEIVEAVHRTSFSDADLAKALSSPTINKTETARKRERLRRLDPGRIRIDAGEIKFFSKAEAEAFALDCVQARDRSWALLFAKQFGI